ncbi:beta-glucosidase A family protein [Ostertagia ostertagi]
MYTAHPTASFGAADFGNHFLWGVAMAAAQNEGAWNEDGRGPSIWDVFARRKGKIKEAFGDRAKNWIVLNEPFGFTSLGYMLGRHAPGKTGLDNFLKAVHHAALAQADGGRVLRSEISNAYIGTSFSCSAVHPHSASAADTEAARKTDILLNRLFIEPLLGKGYPNENFKLIEKLELLNKSWKYTERLRFDMDFIGLQNYFPVVVKHSPFIPYVNAMEVKASSRKVPHTAMGWEISPDGFHSILKKFWKYGGVKEIIVTESGAAFTDKLVNGQVLDTERMHYHQQYLKALLQAKKEGIKIKGYMAWTLTDNFEWSEGYNARFGLVHTDFKTQLRTVKQSDSLKLEARSYCYIAAGAFYQCKSIGLIGQPVRKINVVCQTVHITIIVDIADVHAMSIPFYGNACLPGDVCKYGMPKTGVPVVAE